MSYGFEESEEKTFEVPTLTDLCFQKLTENMEIIKNYNKPIPYQIGDKLIENLKPVLEDTIIEKLIGSLETKEILSLNSPLLTNKSFERFSSLRNLRVFEFEENNQVTSNSIFLLMKLPENSGIILEKRLKKYEMSQKQKNKKKKNNSPSKSKDLEIQPKPKNSSLTEIQYKDFRRTVGQLFGTTKEIGLSSQLEIAYFANQMLDVGRLSQLRIVSFRKCRKLTDQGLCALTLGAPQLEVVRLSSCYRITDKGVMYLSCCRHLRVIDLSWCHRVTDHGISILSKTRGENLNAISISGCAITNTSLQSLGEYCWNLEQVKFHSCFEIDDEGVRLLCAQNRGIESLSCSSTKITDISFNLYLPSLKDLKFLEMSKLHRVSLQALQHLLNNLQKLRFIDFNCCSQISRDDLFVTELKENFPNLEIIY
ncbi:hypothetical protein M0813_06747 [Anaeramoeba flamelloides]|uniref:F-box/LRR-repeat protein 15-like leucin rich repeat domain-containing protein n=1 Tax=Anaeramoeba flamelloides TaxID=1746091 RepID=A0ABQ8XCY3_9EUKA|nr:hypothetical protein M0813_06747 [Anaeramoeba flamelloides]